MTLLSSHRLLPRREDSENEGITTMTDVVIAARRSSDATAFAGWAVATIVMGLVIQIDTVRGIGSRPAVLLLGGLLTLVLAATGRVVVLLSRAARAAADAGAGIGEAGDGAGDVSTSAGAAADPPPAPVAWDRPDQLIAAMRIRDSLARSALSWAYGSGIAFLTWSVLAATLAARG